MQCVQIYIYQKKGEKVRIYLRDIRDINMLKQAYDYIQKNEHNNESIQIKKILRRACLHGVPTYTFMRSNARTHSDNLRIWRHEPWRCCLCRFYLAWHPNAWRLHLYVSLSRCVIPFQTYCLHITAARLVYHDL